MSDTVPRRSSVVSLTARISASSAWSSSTGSAIDRSGSVSSASSSRRHRVSTPRTPASSNRSVANSTDPVSPAGRPASSVVSARLMARSTRAVAVESGAAVMFTPGNSALVTGRFCSANVTWNTGWCAMDRTGLSTSTSCSKGTSWCSNASTARARTWPTSSRNDGSPEVSVRSTRVLTKKPTSSRSASSVRPAIGAPRTMSVPAPRRVSRAAMLACNTMNTVAPDSRASVASPWCSVASRANDSVAPWCVAVAGRGRSVGSSSTAGAPASRSTQYRTCSE